MCVACELIAVSKSYGDRRVIDGLSIRVCGGEMVAITGISGVGKSTVLNVIGLLENPDAGVVKLFGEESPRAGSARAIRMLRSRLSYLFQNGALIDNATVGYNLEIPLAYSALSRGEKRRLKEEALDQVGLCVPLSAKVYELSGGEQQRLAVARILLKPSELVLADEPTGSLDASNRDDVLRLLRGLGAAGKAVVIVSHDEHVAKACDRVIELPEAANYPGRCAG